MTIDEIKSLQDNWNGYGAPKIPVEIIEKAEIILKLLSQKFVAFPIAYPGIQLETENGDDYLEITIDECGKLSIFYCNITEVGRRSINDTNI